MAAVALITGGTGLLGERVLRHWDVAGMEPVVVDRRVDDLLLPGTPERLVERHRPEVVLHLAWCASGTPGYRTSNDNARWAQASAGLCAAAMAAGGRFLGTGTVLDAFAPTDAYSAAKARLRRELEPLIASSGITWLRPFYVVDPERRRPALVARALESGERAEPVVLRTPDSAHDFVHVDDVARAVVLAVAEDLRGEVQIGSGVLRRVRDLVEALGVAWRQEPDGPPPGAGAAAGHDHHAAHVDTLRKRGWTPTRTEELFHRD